MLKNKFAKLGVAVAAIGATLPAFALDPTLADVTSAVSFTTVLAGVVAIGVSVAGVYVLIRGVKILLPLIRG